MESRYDRSRARRALVALAGVVLLALPWQARAASSIWSASATPSLVDGGADIPVELGVKFTSDVAGFVTGIRFFKAAANGGTHVGSLWSSSGTLLATATFTGETSSGWQQASFASPVAVSANTVYVASYHVNGGHYSCDVNAFTGKGVDSPPLHALATGVSGGNGVFAYGSASSFPTLSWNAANYWVDVVFSTNNTVVTLASIAVAPSAPVLQTGSTQQFTATGTYSDGTTADLTSAVTWASTASSVAPVSARGVASALSPGSTTVSASLGAVSGSTVLSVQGTALATSTIWPASAVPALVDGGADSSVELGVKFRSDVAGFVTGIRFYRAAANGGTHVGNLWSSSGTLLATATFTGETSSGWQQVSFANPVAVSASTVYVASYHVNGGHYSVDLNAFTASGVDSPPLHALATGVSGVNGVYAYGASSAFPTLGWKDTNYWVDVVFRGAGAAPDVTPPVVTAFAIPSTTGALVVPVTALAATDTVGVTGYLVNESATAPSATAAGWAGTAPTSYTFTSAGTKTLYAWAKDAAGNVSASRSASVTITLVDVTPPVVTAFAIPSTASALVVPITALAATDAVGVTGYLVNESATAPSATAAGWAGTAPTSYTFTSAGTKTLYAWAKDAAGNVSASRSASVTITLVDVTPPVVTAFAIPSTASALVVPVTALAATDAVGVTGYLVNESATAPSATAAGWAGTAPTSYTFTSAGTKTLYAWAKDAAGNVSASRSASVTITLVDVTPPVVTAFAIPSTASALVVPVTALAATDAVGVTGYLVNESATAPLATATGWAATAPTSYTFATAGTKILYAWAKDAAGNVSASRSASVTIALPTVPEPVGWFAGDMHAHRSCGAAPSPIESMYQGMTSQNLSTVSLLADMGNGEVQDPAQDLPRVNGQDDPISTSGRIVHWDAEWHWDPTYLQYPHQALGGHVVALGTSEAHQIWQEYTYPIFNWAHQAGGIAGFAHMQYLNDQIPQDLSCCTPLEYPVEVALGAADFISEDVVDVGQTVGGMDPEAAIKAYYRLLNTGFRPGLAAGTDIPCNNGSELGSLLTYVQPSGGQMTYRSWVDGIAKGRTVVSRNGHNEFLNLMVNGSATPGDEIALSGGGTVAVTVRWTATQALSGTIELVSNGVVVASQQASVAKGAPSTLSASVAFPKSGWLAARRMGSAGHYVHTGAVFVAVDGAPVRASASDATFYVQWIDNLLQKTSLGGAWSRPYFVNDLAAAQARYQAAKARFQQIAQEAGGVTPPTLASIAVTPASPTITVGSTQQLTATGSYSDGTTADVTSAVTWTSTIPSTVSVSAVGLATALAAGTATVSATLGGVTGSALVTAQAGAMVISTIWPASAVPVLADGGADNPVELGVKFRSDVAGYVTGIRFYKAAANGGTHVGHVWSSSGTLLASATFTGETASGWQQASFASPVAVSANTVYVASYHVNGGHYSADVNAFSGKGVDSPPLHALATGVSGGNGVYAYGSASSFPTLTWNAANYWVDVVFSSQGTQAPTLTSIAVTPANPSLLAGSTQQLVATGTYSDGSTQALTASATWKSSSSTVATVSAGGLVSAAAAGTATISATAGIVTGSTTVTVTTGPLTIATTSLPDGARGLAYSVTLKASGGTPPYTWSIKAGLPPGLALDAASGVISGTPTTVGAFTFTAQVSDSRGGTASATSSIVVAATLAYSLWPSAALPDHDDAGADSPVELGVKFRADVSGVITALRFYKSASNTGSHVGSLWTTSGTRLASATFSRETASGWQEVTLASPVAVTANTTYVASYHTSVGHYAADEWYFTDKGVDHPPLHAPADGVTGFDGLYAYGASSVFPGNGYRATNYWVDVVFKPTTAPTSLVSISISPAGASLAVGATQQFQATASYSDGSTLDVTRAAGWASSDPTVAAVGPSGLAEAVRTGTTQVLAGLDGLTSSTTLVVAAPPPQASEGPGGPILVVSSSGNPFSRYTTEILRAEGLNAFLAVDLANVSSDTLAAYDIVILGDIPLTAGQAQMFASWVTAGGKLIAMRPDKQLAGLLGLQATTSTLSDGYLRVDTSSAPGAGIVGQTIQFHGAADLYTLGGATAIATLYSSATSATSFPAVTLATAGAGQAAAFTYDLARSVVYTRQGNPAWGGQERDGITVIRPDDLFYGPASGDPRDNWIDLTKVAIPQADEQQRLLANLIVQMSLSRRPLPRFWYFPSGYRAVVVMTGDDHAKNGTAGRFDTYLSRSPAGCSVDDWQCIRSTSYMYPETPISSTLAQQYESQGFEAALHVTTDCADWTSYAQLDALYTSQLATFASAFPGLSAPTTSRTHCVVWSDYDSQPKVELAHGIRLDTNYYFYPPDWVNDTPGLFTGSGMPMRFADLTGKLIDVYQATTQMTDESGQSYPKTIDTLLDNALGAAGYYGAFTANMHNDTVASAGSDAIVASAQARGVPVISAQQLLAWLDARNGSSFGSLSWDGANLGFSVAVASGGRNLQAMLPLNVGALTLASITRGGSAVPFSTQTIKGVTYALFGVTPNSYHATYR